MNNASAPQMLADALLRSVAGTTALLRVTACTPAAGSCELGLVSTQFADAAITPAVLRKLRPTYKADSSPQWELLVSATSIAREVSSLQLDSAQSLFAMTLLVIVAGQQFLLESVAANEAFGQVYLYRLLLRQARTQSV